MDQDTPFDFDQQDDDLPDNGAGGNPLPAEAPGAPTMTPQERALRDLFVAEYLVDFNATKAAMRCGFGKQFAVEYAKKFMAEPYVQQRISGIQKLDQRDEVSLEKFNKRRVQEQLMEEAHYHGPGSSQAARVAALKALADMYGMGSAAQARQAAQGGGQVAGGVMVVPEIADVTNWEQTAMGSQKALRDDIVDDQQ